MIRTYTSAPAAYDGFGTREIRVAGTDMRGRDVRLVETPQRHADWQRNRYWSGFVYLTCDEDKWNELIEHNLVKLVTE